MHKNFSKIAVALALTSTLAGLAPVAFGATQVEQCTLRAAITKDEAFKLAPPAGTSGDTAVLYPAGTVLGQVASATPPVTATSAYGLFCSFAIIKQIADLLFLLVTILAVAAIVYSAYLFLTSAGDPKKTEEAKNWLLYAIVGLVVAVIAKIIPSVATTLIGIG